MKVAIITASTAVYKGGCKWKSNPQDGGGSRA